MLVNTYETSDSVFFQNTEYEKHAIQTQSENNFIMVVYEKIII